MNSANCEYFAVLQDSSQKLRVQFNDFSLENGVDFLQIGNMNYTGSELPQDVVSTSNEFAIKFITDHSISRKGFSLTLSGVD